MTSLPNHADSHLHLLSSLCCLRTHTLWGLMKLQYSSFEFWNSYSWEIPLLSLNWCSKCEVYFNNSNVITFRLFFYSSEQFRHAKLLSTWPTLLAGGSQTSLQPELHSTCHEYVNPHYSWHWLHLVWHFGSGKGRCINLKSIRPFASKCKECNLLLSTY